MAKLQPGTILRTERFKTVKVIKEIGGGGQGVVYLVDYDGEKKALKWYSNSNRIINKKAFYENLKRNISIGAPSPKFLWPIDLTEFSHGAVGYIMDLKPDNYIELTKFFRNQQFASFRASIDAMINMAHAFRLLHNKGYCYLDLNDGNFFVDPKTGDVLICDNDNVSPAGDDPGIKGKCRYMAPEVVLGAMPDKRSDRFSLALIFFMMLCKAHPLEGSGATPPCLNSTSEREIYGQNPVFIFDPNNPSNRPIRGVHEGTVSTWNALPGYMKEIFMRAFSAESLSLTGPRVMERDWIEALAKFRNSVMKCACGIHQLVDAKSPVCTRCGKKLNVFNEVNLPVTTIPAFPGVNIFRCQIEPTCPDERALDVVAQVIASPKDPLRYGLGNCSNTTWECIRSDGQQSRVGTREVLPIQSGIKVHIGEKSISIT